MNPIYPAHCAPCLAKRECVSLPYSINCEWLRRVDPVTVAAKDMVKQAGKTLNEIVESVVE